MKSRKKKVRMQVAMVKRKRRGRIVVDGKRLEVGGGRYGAGLG